jgi:hypothetical protein
MNCPIGPTFSGCIVLVTVWFVCRPAVHLHGTVRPILQKTEVHVNKKRKILFWFFCGDRSTAIARVAMYDVLLSTLRTKEFPRAEVHGQHWPVF